MIMDALKDSYYEHNSQYEEDGKITTELAHHMRDDAENASRLYSGGYRHGEVLDSTDFDVAVDIGSGSGWFSNYLVEKRNYKKVYAIEPSAAAQEIASKIYSRQDKVERIVGFAEEEISKLKLKTPTLFSTLVVLAHIRNEVVQKILESVDQVAPKGSVLCSLEPWGDEFHHDPSIWHVRPTEWWQNIMPKWEFSFEKRCEIPWPNTPKRWTGFTATKTED